MAKRNSTVLTNTSEKKNTKVVCCMDCAWANLIQYGNNPVLAECQKRPNPESENFPYERMVASTRWICPSYSEGDSNKTVEKREHRVA